jgi:hypothetical protein
MLMTEGKRVYFITKIGFRCPICHKEHFFDAVDLNDKDIDKLEAAAPFWGPTTAVQFTECGTFRADYNPKNIVITLISENKKDEPS